MEVLLQTAIYTSVKNRGDLSQEINNAKELHLENKRTVVSKTEKMFVNSKLLLKE